MAEQSILGKNEILFIYAPLKDAEGDVVAANYFPVGCLTTNDLSKTIEMQDGTITKCNTSPDPIYGKKSYQITFEAVNIENEGTRASIINSFCLSLRPLFFTLTLSDNGINCSFDNFFVSIAPEPTRV